MIFAIIILANISLGDGNEQCTVSISGPTMLTPGEIGVFVATKDSDSSFPNGWTVVPGDEDSATK